MSRRHRRRYAFLRPLGIERNVTGYCRAEIKLGCAFRLGVPPAKRPSAFRRSCGLGRCLTAVHRLNCGSRAMTVCIKGDTAANGFMLDKHGLAAVRFAGVGHGAVGGDNKGLICGNCIPCWRRLLVDLIGRFCFQAEDHVCCGIGRPFIHDQIRRVQDLQIRACERTFAFIHRQDRYLRLGVNHDDRRICIHDGKGVIRSRLIPFGRLHFMDRIVSCHKAADDMGR